MLMRESGMPPQDYWETLLHAPRILDAFGFDARTRDVTELGCGYGTFTLPLAQRIAGRVFAIDLDPAMVAATRERAATANAQTIDASVRDVLADGFGAAAGSCDAALLFNILHGEEPVAMLRAARAVVRPGGLIAVIHWRSDVATPRGPSLEIRPRAHQIIRWAAEAELATEGNSFDLPPWHYGVKLIRASPRS